MGLLPFSCAFVSLHLLSSSRCASFYLRQYLPPSTSPTSLFLLPHSLLCFPFYHFFAYPSARPRRVLSSRFYSGRNRTRQPTSCFFYVDEVLQMASVVPLNIE